jgi:hypothetical protein
MCYVWGTGYVLRVGDRICVTYRGQDMCYVWGTDKVHTGLWSRDLMGRDHLQDQGMDGRIILKWILNKSYGKQRLDLFGLR